MNVFEKAKAKPVASPKSQIEETRVNTKGLEIYAYVDALEKTLATLKETLKADVLPSMFDQFIVTKGENYKGEELTARASLELRKRASTSGLKPMEIELCSQHNITVKQIEGDFKLNVEGLSPKKLQEVSDALAKVKGLPDDFITFDAKKARTITVEASIDEVFKLNDKETIKALLPVVGVPAIKPSTTADLPTILKEVSSLLVPSKKK